MARGSRVVFHEKLKTVRERFGLDVRLEGLAAARRADVPVQRIHHVMAGAVMAVLGLALAGLLIAVMVGLNAWLSGEGVANQAFIRDAGLTHLFQGEAGQSRLGYWLVGVTGLVAAIGMLVCGSPADWVRDLFDRLVRVFSPPFTRRPYALYVRRAQKTDAPGPLDLSVAGEARFVRAFHSQGPTVCVGTNRVPVGDDEPEGTARMIVKDRDEAWIPLVDMLDSDAAFTAVDVTDPTDRVLALVRRMANGESGPRFGLLIALGTPERRMQSWKAVAQAIAGTPARVTPVAPKAPPCVMLIDGSIWTALGQAPHAQGAAQLSVTLSDETTQGLFDVAANS
ncbi:MAG: hypothetical protein AAF253_01160 [Pseudomonadota bacterium]